MPSNKKQNLFKRLWRKTLSDYVTAIAWSLDGTWLAASSAAGEIVRYEVQTGKATVLQAAQGESIDVLAISAEGEFLAAGGQAGTVWIWRLENDASTLLKTLEHPRTWIDCLRWNPQCPELAFSLGRHVQVWDAMTQGVITTLNFESSSVLDIAWHPRGDLLSVSGNQIIKTWQRQDWDDDPTVLETGAASEAIAWSPEGTYFAAGNSDRSLLVWKEGNPRSWRMQDFPGKVQQLSWSMPTENNAASNAVLGAPLLASASSASIIVWTKDNNPAVGWNPRLLDAHRGKVSAIAFQPNSRLLASAAEDGYLCLWNKGSHLTQTLKDAPAELSCLVWNHSGDAIAAGDNQGNVLTWTKTMAGKGFG